MIDKLKRDPEYRHIEDDNMPSNPDIDQMSKQETREEFRRIFGHYPDEK